MKDKEKIEESKNKVRELIKKINEMKSKGESDEEIQKILDAYGEPIEIDYWISTTKEEREKERKIKGKEHNSRIKRRETFLNNKEEKMNESNITPTDTISVLDIPIKEFLIELCKENDVDFDRYWKILKEIIKENENKNREIIRKNDWELKEKGVKKRKEFLKKSNLKERIKGYQSQIIMLKNRIERIEHEIETLKFFDGQEMQKDIKKNDK